MTAEPPPGGRLPGQRRPLSVVPPPPPGRALVLGRPRRRLRTGLLAVAFVFSLFAGRLIQLQAVNTTDYGAAASSSRLTDYTLTATRGSILDSAGNPLAESVNAVDVVADPAQIKTLKQDPAVYASKLAALLGDPPGTADVATLRRELSAVPSQYQLIAKQITPQTWNKVKQLGLSGVYGISDAATVYPQGAMATNVIGYVNASGAGGSGLELANDKLLAGKNGSISYQAASGVEIPTAGINEQVPESGGSVVTTINSQIQYEAQQAIASAVQSTGADSGTVVVMDPRTGAVLALATAPSYDPADYQNTDPSLLGDRAISEVYEPGSVAKVVTMSAVIQQGEATPLTHVVVPAFLPLDGTVFHDDTTHGTEDLTLNGVLAESSNIGTVLASNTLGPNRNQILYDYLTKFGIGQPSGLGLPGESPGILAPWSQWNASQQYTIAYGQGVSVNAVQATSVFATIADSGVRVTPNIVRGYLSPAGVFTPAPAAARTVVISPQTAAQVGQMMESVVSGEGTAAAAEIPGYRVAGKTGTANRYDNACDGGKGGYCGHTASFIGFAPADDPQLVVSVVLQDPRDAADYAGGAISAPVFKQVMSFGLQDLGIAPTGTKSPDLPVTW
ncbi:MAG TPA: penicillin-binding protein 2 [Actinocrinis sp.]|nr:penicillin-binding protein 2 [Actinocrinis sp.]